MVDSFITREQQFEAKFAHDEALKFKITSHRNKLFAGWLAEQMGAAAPSGYADSFLAFAMARSPSALIEKAQQDLNSHGVSLTDSNLHKAFEQLHDRAEAEVLAA